MRKVFIFVPAFGQNVTSTTFMATHALQQAFAAKSIGASVSTLSFPDIAELRAMATTIWYDTMPDVDYLLFIDADMGFVPDMVLDMILFDEPLVGAIYRQRSPNVSWAGSGSGEGVTVRRGNFMQVEGVGMGCTLIRRGVIETMLAKFPELVDTRLDLHPAGNIIKAAGAKRLIRSFEKLDLPTRGIVSEDLSFCLRWRQCGGETWAAIGYPISHVGPYDYSGCYLQHVTQEGERADQAQRQAMQAAQLNFIPPSMQISTAGPISPLAAVELPPWEDAPPHPVALNANGKRPRGRPRRNSKDVPKDEARENPA